MTARTAPGVERLPAAIRTRLTRVAADAVGPFGQTPLTRLVATHLSLFAELRRLGASWAQIAALLADLGIAGTDGPTAGDVLRATYVRARAQTAARNGAARNETQRAETRRNVAKHLDATSQPNAIDQNATRSDVAERDIGTDETVQRNAAGSVETSRRNADRSLLLRAELLNRPTRTR